MHKIVRTEQADYQLRKSILYIAENAGDIEVALRYLSKVEKAIKRLEEFPNSGSYPRLSTLKRQGYRMLIVEKHIIFYKVDTKQLLVTIYAIVDNRREYAHLL